VLPPLVPKVTAGPEARVAGKDETPVVTAAHPVRIGGVADVGDAPSKMVCCVVWVIDVKVGQWMQLDVAPVGVELDVCDDELQGFSPLLLAPIA
jgi:hypothetical protein